MPVIVERRFNHKTPATRGAWEVWSEELESIADAMRWFNSRGDEVCPEMYDYRFIKIVEIHMVNKRAYTGPIV